MPLSAKILVVRNLRPTVAIPRVQRGACLGPRVELVENVHFLYIRGVVSRADRPPIRPRGRPGRHMVDVQYEQAGSEQMIGVDVHRVTAMRGVRRHNAGVVRANIDLKMGGLKGFNMHGCSRSGYKSLNF